MPHKHRRNKKDEQDQFELPPTSIARPLSAAKTAKNGTHEKISKSQKGKRKRSQKVTDDTPRAFTRLMEWQKGNRPRSGLDNGEQRSKKRKLDANEAAAPGDANTKEPASLVPKILPGERMADYSARVDAALPIGGLVNKRRGVKLPGVKKQPRTKLERKLQRMHNEWRETDARYKEKLEALQDEAQEEEDPHQEALDSILRSKKKNRGTKPDDPWAAVGQVQKAQQQGRGGLVGVHDVVLAPPQLKAIKERFKVRDGARIDVANVPGSAGSLRRREELGEVRKGVITEYRSLSKNKEKR